MDLSGTEIDGPATIARAPIHEGVVGRAFDRVRREFEAERERWPLWLPAFMAAGIALYFALPFEPAHWPAAFIALLALAVAFVGRRRGWVAPAALPIAALAFGFALGAWRTDQVAAPRLDHRIGPAMVSGRVVEVEEVANGRRITLDHPAIERLAPSDTPARVRVRIRGDEPALRPGDSMRVRAVLLPPSSPVAPGAFDFERHAYFLRLGGVGYAYGKPSVEPARPSGFSLWLAALRDRIAARVEARLPGAVGGIAAALMTGERGAIPPDVVEAMRDSGLAHLLAIAGLHLGLITGALFFGVRALLALVPYLALRYPIKKWAASVALCGAFFYLMITGATVPTQRAFLMTGVVLLGVMLDRTSISMRMVCWAAVAVMLIQPESVLGPSFQLSFAAVIALIAAYEVWRGRLLGFAGGPGLWRLPLLYVAGVAFTSLVTSLATIPYSLYHFDRLAAFGVATNMIAVPVTALWVMPWAILAYVLMPFGLDGLALGPMGGGIEIVIWSAKTIVALPGSVAILPAMPVWGAVVVSFGLLWLCLWQRPWRLAGLGAIALGLASIALVRPPDVIVSGDGSLFAARAADGHMMVSRARGAAFDVDTILKRAGQTERDPWPKSGASADGSLDCTEFGCRYNANGQRVALVKAPGALTPDCHWATILVSAVALRYPCPSARLVIDRNNLWRAGGHALWIDPSGVEVESVADWRGIRPWTPQRPTQDEGVAPVERDEAER
jgi:competence protein ComEC